MNESFHAYECPQQANLQRQESILVAAEAAGRRFWGVTANLYEVWGGADEDVLKVDVDVTNCEYNKSH